jgi:hypothetical protein
VRLARHQGARKGCANRPGPRFSRPMSHVLAGIAGVFLISVVLRDAFESVVLPQTGPGPAVCIRRRRAAVRRGKAGGSMRTTALDLPHAGRRSAHSSTTSADLGLVGGTPTSSSIFV